MIDHAGQARQRCRGERRERQRGDGEERGERGSPDHEREGDRQDHAPVAAEVIAGRPPTIEITTAMVNDANSPTPGSTPAMIENEIASGINASATTRPARTSVRATRGENPGSRQWR